MHLRKPRSAPSKGDHGAPKETAIRQEGQKMGPGWSLLLLDFKCPPKVARRSAGVWFRASPKTKIRALQRGSRGSEGNSYRSRGSKNRAGMVVPALGFQVSSHSSTRVGRGLVFVHLRGPKSAPYKGNHGAPEETAIGQEGQKMGPG